MLFSGQNDLRQKSVLSLLQASEYRHIAVISYNRSAILIKINEV